MFSIRLTASTFVFASVVGCNSEAPIVTYVVPTTMPAALREEPTRMVAAIVPQSDQAWFFKIAGPKSAVDLVAPTFRDFVASVGFADGKPVLSDLPENWRRGGERAMRFATIDIETPSKQLDVSVSQLAKMDDWPSLISANVNRWRKQVGLPESDQKWAGADVLPRKEMSETEPAIWLDVTGTPDASAPTMAGLTSAGMMGTPPPDMGADPHAGLPREAQAEVAAAKKRGTMTKPKTTATSAPKTDGDSPLDYETPADWRPGRMSSMRMAAFSVGPEDAGAEVTVISAGGDLRGNVARWMGQVIGSAPDDAAVDQTLASAEKRTVSGRDAQRFILLPEVLGGGDGASAIDATIVPLENDFSLFVKLTGPAEVIRDQTEAMGTFLDSLRLKQ